MACEFGFYYDNHLGLEGVGRPRVYSIIVYDVQKGVVDVSTGTAMVAIGNYTTKQQ